MAMTSVRMPDELMDRLEKTANEMDRSKGWIINHALTAYLDAEQVRLKRLAETQAALDEAARGQLIDGDAVMDWLDTWGTDNEGKTPGR